MNKTEIDELCNNKCISDKEKLDILYQEFYDSSFNVGYYKEKANMLELKINEIKNKRIL